jgi:hypothetical protein
VGGHDVFWIPYEDWRAYSMQYQGTGVRDIDYCTPTATRITASLLILFALGNCGRRPFCIRNRYEAVLVTAHECQTHCWSQKRSSLCQSSVWPTPFYLSRRVSHRFIKKEFAKLSEINVRFCSPPKRRLILNTCLEATSRDSVCDLCCSIRYNDCRVPLLSSVRKSNGI